MPKASVLQFHNYTVDELFYKNTPTEINHGQFEIHPNFEHRLVKTGENTYDMMLSMEISPTEEYPVPFQLKVSIIGHFEYMADNQDFSEELKSNLINQNTVSILFPFLRAIVASLTTNANIPTLTLPIMNFAEDT